MAKAQRPANFADVDPQDDVTHVLPGGGPSDVTTQILRNVAPPDEAVTGVGRAVPPAPPSRGARGQLQRGDALGRYVILSPLGSGAMGVVYAAYDPELNRVVAVKVMTGAYASTPVGRQRLLREAQALARLSHPNVVAVHDVGSLPDGIFLAMQHVAGRTLHAWLREAERSQKEILAAFRGAGLGLAAAHAEGIVHRDFKPGNVLIGQDGRPRVVDFGLARKAPGVGELRPELSMLPAGGVALDANLTAPGQILGTPRYMAPEQAQGGEVGPATDQFAFCVALYAALYGESPFDDPALPPTLALALKNWRVREAPKASRVPQRLRRTLLRGLSIEPHHRFPSMGALLDELDHDPARAQRLWVAGGIAAAFGVTLGLGLSARATNRNALCSGAEQHLAGVWDGPRRDAVRSALLASPLPFAKDTWARLEPLLNGYASKWAAAHAEACRATRVRGEQSEQALDLRMACLRQRRNDLKALTDLLAANPAGAAERAVQAAYALGDLRGCDDVRALSQPVPPTDARARAGVEALSNELSAVKALEEAGRYQEGLKRAAEALAKASELGHKSSEARAGYYLGKLRRRVGDAKGAEQAQMAAMTAAVAGRDDTWLAHSAREIGWCVGADQRRFDEGLAWARFAMAAAERQGQGTALVAKVVSAQGSILLAQGKYDESRQHFLRALDLYRETVGPDHPDAVDASRGLAVLDKRSMHYEDGHARALEVLRLRERTVGAQHPLTGDALNDLAAVEFDLKRYESASTLLKRAIAVLESALGRDHRKVALALSNLAEVQLFLGHDAEARTLLARALAIYEKTIPSNHPYFVESYLLAGLISLRAGKAQGAVRELERSRAVLGADGGFKLIDRPNVGIALARALYLAGSRERARQIVKQARSELPAEQLASAEAYLADLGLAGPPVTDSH